MNHPYWNAPLSQILAVAFNLANEPCLRPTHASGHGDYRRCAHGAKGDLTWMCLACQMRQLRFGPYCEGCKCNHMGDCD